MGRWIRLLWALLAISVSVPGDLPNVSRAVTPRPNFVVIVADDLDSGSVPYMSEVNRLLADGGMSFTRFFATTPLCCPSRASILRGQYAHNHGVLRNTGEDAGFTAFRDSGHESATMATLLQGAGYETALIGKYLNGYAERATDPAYIPPGWDYWAAGIDHQAYSSFDYVLNVNGELVHYDRRKKSYMTDVLREHALGFLDRVTADGGPFLLYLAPYAPHSPSTPAPRHEGMFAGKRAPRTPAFNQRRVRDKPDWVRKTGRLTETRIDRIDAGYALRLESLQAVDEMVSVVMDRLQQSGLLESTYILFLSDNGYFLGEYRQPHGKDAPYDAASRVPLIIRGPGVPAGGASAKIASNVDLLPTLLDLAGVPIPNFVDGRSLRPLLEGNPRAWRRATLLEGFGKETESNEQGELPTPAFKALRTDHILYVEYETGERELYDLRDDPSMLSNIYRRSPKPLRRLLSRKLRALSTCAGAACRTIENEPLRAGAEVRRVDLTGSYAVPAFGLPRASAGMLVARYRLH